MSATRRMIRRKAELEREIVQLESRMKDSVIELKHQTIEGVQPSSVIKRYPLQSLGVVAVVGLTATLFIKVASRKRQIVRSSDSEFKQTYAGQAQHTKSQSNSPIPSLLTTVRAELQNVIVHQVIDGLSHYLNSTISSIKDTREKQRSTSDRGRSENSESKM